MNPMSLYLNLTLSRTQLMASVPPPTPHTKQAETNEIDIFGLVIS
jgi:hypothetical protein